MVRRVFVLVLGCLVVTAAAGSADTKTGEVKFTGKKDSAKVALGEKLKLEAEYQVIEVGPLAAVAVRATVKNPTNAKMHFAYHVAFLDKDKNLIGCQGGNLFVDATKEIPTGTFIQLPPDQIARIAYYSVAFYESDKPIGSK